MKKMTLDNLKISSFLTGSDTRRLLGGYVVERLVSDADGCMVSRREQNCPNASGSCQAA